MKKKGSRRYRQEQERKLDQGDRIIYENYKDPLKKFKRGFGYEGTVAVRESDGRVQCHYCGDFFNRITPKHLEFCTKGEIINVKQYKEDLDLDRTTSLVSKATSEKMRKAYFKSGAYKEYIPMEDPMSPERIEHLQKLARDRRGKHFKLKLEYKNKRGTCPDQLKDKIIKLKEELGHVPSKKEFVEHYETRFIGPIYKTFGGYNAAVIQCGFEPVNKPGNAYETEHLLGLLKDFYEKTGRVPMYKDMNGYDLPVGETYRKRFGSINEARLMARIPQLRQREDHRIVEV